MTEVIEETRAAIHIGLAGYCAWSNSLVGNASPRVSAYYERAKAPQPGDLVVETSSFLLRLSPRERAYGEIVDQPERCVGWLVSESREFVAWPKDDWTEDNPGYIEHCYYVRPYGDPDAKPVRWVNASFIAVPSTFEQFYEWEKS